MSVVGSKCLPILTHTCPDVGSTGTCRTAGCGAVRWLGHIKPECTVLVLILTSLLTPLPIGGLYFFPAAMPVAARRGLRAGRSSRRAVPG